MVSFKQVLFVSAAALSVLAQDNPNASTTTVVVTNTTSTNNTSNSSDELTELQKCAIEKKCDLSKLDCQAMCTGVPNPTKSQIADTTNCVANCNNTNVEEYKTCTANCINKYYKKYEIPGNSNNSTNSTNSKNGTSNNSSSTMHSSPISNMIGAIIASTMLLTYYKL